MTILRFQRHVKILLRHSSDDVRVRFAPSPTGHLHLGGLRTALYNYLFAKSRQGKFILRIEDTDQSRLVPGAARQLEEVLEWTGLVPDESPSRGGQHGPYNQSERLEIYQRYAQQLLDQGLAYRCFCSEKRLELLKREAARTKQPNKYDRKCYHLPQSEVEQRLADKQPHTIRFLLGPELQKFTDLVYGEFSHDVFATEGDPVIIKSDGFPTYHFANVVDDHTMEVTHVLRGVEWQVSTPKHLLLYKAFGWKPPEFGHLPLIMNQDGTKLSKRQGDLHLDTLRRSGFYPDTILSFVTLVGGGFEEKDSTGEVVYSVQQLWRMFNASKINRNSCKLDMGKLQDLNRVKIKEMMQSEHSRAELIESCKIIIREKLSVLELSPDNVDDDTVWKYLTWGQDRIHKLSDLAGDDLIFLWHWPDKSQLEVELNNSQFREILNLLNSQQTEDSKIIMKQIKNFSKSQGLKFPAVMKDLRVVITGKAEGPPITELLDILGVDQVLARLSNFIEC